MTALLVGDLNSGALALPGHDVLGPNPGIALLHLDQQEPVNPGLLTGLQHAVRTAFSRVYPMGRGYFGDHLHSLLRIEGDPIARRLTENDLFFAWLAALLAPAADSFFQKVDPGNVRPPGF